MYYITDTASIVCKVGSMKLMSICLSACPIIGPLYAAVGLAASRYQLIAAWPVISSKREQCHAQLTYEAEQRLVKIT